MELVRLLVSQVVRADVLLLDVLQAVILLVLLHVKIRVAEEVVKLTVQRIVQVVDVRMGAAEPALAQVVLLHVIPVVLQNVLGVLWVVTIIVMVIVIYIARRAHRHVQVLVEQVAKHHVATVVV